MEFSPKNNVVKLCLQGMNLEENGKAEEAKNIFLRAWDEAASGFEKFIAAHFVARHQNNISDQLTWLQTQLNLALQVNDDAVKPAFALLYAKIGECYKELRDTENAEKYFTLANSCTQAPADKGPFYHGTKAHLKAGDLLTAGFGSNYKSDLIMNHIYFTAMINGAGLAASMAKGDGEERVYIVDPTGEFENDPNVTNVKFPGNPTRSYRSYTPLKIVGELSDWMRTSPEEIQKWREKLADNKGEIIN